jgi:signal transduction histidine kinase
MTEEALSDAHIDALAAMLADQPRWSDISVLLFAGDIRGESALRILRKLEVLRNVTLLDRPVRIAAVISAVQAAIRGRQRQYELRDVLVALEAARADAERANRVKDEFLATLSHELSTPLNAILGWVSMLRQSRVDAQEVPRILEIIERNALVQTQLVTDVLDVSRMITGHTRLQLSTQALPRILADAVESVRPAAEARGVALFVDAIDDAVINADPQRLQQVFWNLLSNAVKFTPSGGRVTLTLRRLDRFVDVAIADTGIGLSTDFLPFAFERFRQADQTFTRSHGGLGLGLAIVKHLVELHGGEVSAASPGVGSGATFRVRLPIAKERPGAPGIDTPARSLSSDGPPPADAAAGGAKDDGLSR